MLTEDLMATVHDVDASSLIRELARRISYVALAKEVSLSEDELRACEEHRAKFPPDQLWKLVRTAYKHDFFDLLPAHGVPLVSYNLNSPFDILAAPMGFDDDPPIVPLIKRPAKIAGLTVDFPLGLPASVLAANSKWIKFYARRGFDILTYKTVRTVFRSAHPFPNWVFVKNPMPLASEFSPEKYIDKKGFVGAKALGCPGYWPEELETLSMANSFGVPSLQPDWWEKDIAEARNGVREGHQVLIVSVVGSKNGAPDDPISLRRKIVAEDFIEAALRAKASGADIIEANFSCPNVATDPIGDLYHYPEDCAYVSLELKKALGPTPLFVKIGYLPEIELRKFVALNEAIDGITAINTISARVTDEAGKNTFPDSGKVPRHTAGISGWAIAERAREVTNNLVAIRSNLCRAGRKSFSILSVGGIVSASDIRDRLSLLDPGFDGVESCTGAFLNPYLGFEARCDEKAEIPSALGFGVDLVRKFFEDVILNPSSPPGLRVDTKTRRVVVEKR